jgi:amidophosphoribosyltransferase
VVVPVPDTAKAAADAFAYHLRIPCMEGLIRNRYVGRTFIQSGETRIKSANSKYTPLPSVLQGKRVFVIEDSIVRSTTLKVLVEQLRVRVACPPIVAPCFYGIDMSTLDELFAPKFLGGRYRGKLSEKELAEMAKVLEVDSLRYLDVADMAPTIGCKEESLCLSCVTGVYPTEWGTKLFKKAKMNLKKGEKGRTYA